MSRLSKNGHSLALVGGILILGADEEGANDGAEDAEAGNPEGKRDQVGHGEGVVHEHEFRSGEGARSDDGTGVGFEKVSTHASDVADVVTDVDQQWLQGCWASLQECLLRPYLP